MWSFNPSIRFSKEAHLDLFRNSLIVAVLLRPGPNRLRCSDGIRCSCPVRASLGATRVGSPEPGSGRSRHGRPRRGHCGHPLARVDGAGALPRRWMGNRPDGYGQRRHRRGPGLGVSGRRLRSDLRRGRRAVSAPAGRGHGLRVAVRGIGIRADGYRRSRAWQLPNRRLRAAFLNSAVCAGVDGVGHGARGDVERPDVHAESGAFVGWLGLALRRRRRRHRWTGGRSWCARTGRCAGCSWCDRCHGSSGRTGRRCNRVCLHASVTQPVRPCGHRHHLGHERADGEHHTCPSTGNIVVAAAGTYPWTGRWASTSRTAIIVSRSTV